MTKKKQIKHTTLDGHELVYDEPGGDLAAFLDRVVAYANDPQTSDDKLIELIYGVENPILDKTIFPGRGAVTREAFNNPVYHVMLDWLCRKQQALGKLDVDAAIAAATMTVAEAAAELGMTTSAVRQAIRARKLAAVKVGRGYMLAPHDVATYAKHSQRRGPAGGPMLEARIGNVEGKSCRLKAVGSERVSREGSKSDVVVQVFRRAAVAISEKRANGEKTNRMFVLEPGEAVNEYRRGPFWIRGRFKIVEKINNAKAAAEAFRDFEPR